MFEYHRQPMEVASRTALVREMSETSLVLGPSHGPEIFNASAWLETRATKYMVSGTGSRGEYSRVTVSDLVAAVKDNPSSLEDIVTNLDYELKTWQLSSDIFTLKSLISKRKDPFRAGYISKQELENEIKAKVTELSLGGEGIKLQLAAAENFMTQVAVALKQSRSLDADAAEALRWFAEALNTNKTVRDKVKAQVEELLR